MTGSAAVSAPPPPSSPSRSGRRPDLLVLARHASAGDVGAAARMGERWRALGVDLVVSSVTPRAMETGAAAADALGVVFQTGHDLHEHLRATIGTLSDEVFEASVRGLFERPDVVVFGEESGAAAERRFAASVDALCAAHRGLRLAIVGHGTVLALHLAARYRMDAWRTWQRLGRPSYVVVDRGTRMVVDVVETV
jgi:2,3-bisphosphoglycerate-dependent phosphoglycerate mutase